MFSDKDQVVISYGYSPINSEFAGQFEYFWAKDTGLAANSTLIAPPSATDGHVAVFDVKTNSWTIVEDHRGKTIFNTATKEPYFVDYLGPIKDGYTLLEPEFNYLQWSVDSWVDMRTDAEKRTAYLASFPDLTKRQFNLYLYDSGLKDEVDALLSANPRAKVEFDSTDTVVRTSPTVEAMIALLGWTDEQVNTMWEQALTL